MSRIPAGAVSEIQKNLCQLSPADFQLGRNLIDAGGVENAGLEIEDG